MPGDGWQEEYKERVLAEFRRVHEDIEKLSTKIDTLKDSDLTDMKLAIAKMEQQNKDSARTWGVISGMITSIIVSLVIWAITTGIASAHK